MTSFINVYRARQLTNFLHQKRLRRLPMTLLLFSWCHWKVLLQRRWTGRRKTARQKSWTSQFKTELFDTLRSEKTRNIFTFLSSILSVKSIIGGQALPVGLQLADALHGVVFVSYRNTKVSQHATPAHKSRSESTFSRNPLKIWSANKHQHGNGVELFIYSRYTLKLWDISNSSASSCVLSFSS